MIISFRHKFIFVAIPKTATQAVRHSLRPHLAPNDWEQAIFSEPRFFPVQALADIGHGHLSVQDVRPFLPGDHWDDFFSFAFVRNPFDRFISFCAFYQKDANAFEINPAGTMKAILSDPALHRHTLMLPQHHFLTDEEGDIAVSFVGRYEQIHADFDIVCKKVAVSQSPLIALNASKRQAARAYFDDELEEMVRDFYRRDFELFAYDPILSNKT